MATSTQPAKHDRVFTKLPKGTKPPTKETPLIASYFFKQGNIMKSRRYFVLYENHVYYYDEKDDQQPKGVTELDFELRFEVIREKKEMGDKGKEILGKPKGLRFDRDGCSCELFSSNEKEILEWRNFLRGKINQRGFHELFRAQRKIGKGNFASVYLAERLEDERLFAVKAFSKEAAYNQEKGKEALITEIQLMRELDNPHIMKLHEVFETENSLYFILDLLEGGQLYDKIKAKYKFTPDETRSIMRGLVEGIAHMHQKDIMHRDLKPENILFRKPNDYSSVVIADLGLGTRVHIPEYLFVRCGTPGFVAPEVVNIKDLRTTYDAVCDMFSLGLIFHILLMGKSPFSGKTYNEVLAQNRAGTVKLEGPEYLRVPNDAYDLLKKMLEKEPQNRINSQNALKHSYFQQKPTAPKKDVLSSTSETSTQKADEHFKEFEEGEDAVYEDEREGSIQKTMNQFNEHKFDMARLNRKQVLPGQSPVAQSPALLPRRLPQQALDADSCVAFKMAGSPVLTGNLEKVAGGNTGDQASINVIMTPTLEPRMFRNSPNAGKSSFADQSQGRSPGMSKYAQKNSNEVRNKLQQFEVGGNSQLQQIDESEEEKKKEEDPNQKKAVTKQVKSIASGLRGNI